MALWLLMSGLFKPLLIGLGVVSSILCAWIVHKLRLHEDESKTGATIRPLGMIQYLFWLTVEIGKADWAVAKVILGSSDKLSQQLIKIPVDQKTDLARALYANSITITPGTVCVETEADHFVIHALDNNAADRDALAAMGARVTALEGSSS